MGDIAFGNMGKIEIQLAEMRIECTRLSEIVEVLKNDMISAISAINDLANLVGSSVHLSVDEFNTSVGDKLKCTSDFMNQQIDKYYEVNEFTDEAITQLNDLTGQLFGNDLSNVTYVSNNRANTNDVVTTNFGDLLKNGEKQNELNFDDNNFSYDDSAVAFAASSLIYNNFSADTNKTFQNTSNFENVYESNEESVDAYNDLRKIVENRVTSETGPNSFDVKIPEDLHTDFTIYTPWSEVTATGSQQYKLRELAKMNGNIYEDADGFYYIIDKYGEKRYTIATTEAYLLNNDYGPNAIGQYLDFTMADGSIIKAVVVDVKNPLDSNYSIYGHMWRGDGTKTTVLELYTAWDKAHANPHEVRSEFAQNVLMVTNLDRNYFDECN